MEDDSRPTPDAEPDAQKLDAFLRGELSDAESGRVVAWAKPQPEWDSSRLWERLEPQLDEKQVGRSQTVSDRHRRFPSASRRWVPAIAAALLVAVLGGVWAYFDRVPQSSPVVVAKTYQTERGQRVSFQLPDGSAIQLGPQSRLRFDSTFGVTNRIVVLEGDGYFHVTHDATRPFVVLTSQGEVRDLGTRFVIRARGDSLPVDVAVAEGTVALARSITPGAGIATLGTDSVIVTAGEIATMDDGGPEPAIPVRDIERYFAWTRGELVFDRTPLTQVLSELNRWFAEEFVLGDPRLGTVRLTTVLQGETLAEALLVLETSLDMDIERADGKLVLRRRGIAADTSGRR